MEVIGKEERIFNKCRNRGMPSVIASWRNARRVGGARMGEESVGMQHTVCVFGFLPPAGLQKEKTVLFDTFYRE